MTIQTLIDKVCEEKPNTFGEAKLVTFINEIEREVAEQLALPAEEIPSYTYPASKNYTLLAPAPYDRLYVSYLKAMIDYSLEEYASYQLNSEQHERDFADYVDWVVRTSRARKVYTPARFRNILY